MKILLLCQQSTRLLLPVSFAARRIAKWIAKWIKATLIPASLIMLTGLAGPAVAESSLKALLSLGGASSLFQDIDYATEGRDLESKSGSGVLFDWAMKTSDSIFSDGINGHAVAVDYYSAGETEGINTLTSESIFVGYRYHFLSGFYAGGSIALISELELSPADVSADANPLAYTLGYTYNFPIGLALGVHYMNTLPTDYELETPLPAGRDLEDLSIRMIGATVGFLF